MKKLTVMFIGLLLVVPCQADIIIVDANGTGDYPTIQAAIDNSNNDDIIELQPGIYTGDGNRDIDFFGKAITVRSTEPNDPNIVAATIIDCNGTEAEAHRGFYFHNDEDANSVLDGLTISNGYHGGGGAIYCWYNTGPKIMNCIIVGNRANAGGGIGCLHGTSPTVTNCIISGNSAEDHGGGIFCNVSDLSIINSTITDNSADWYGGAIYSTNFSDGIQTTLNITDCNITGNWSLHDGGAIYNLVSGGDQTMIITDCNITNNWSNFYAGAIFSVKGPSGEHTVIIDDCTISNNSTMGDGGGLFLVKCDGEISDCTIGGNSARSGSGIWLDQYAGEISKCTISGNLCNRFGGGIYCDVGSATIVNCVITQNRTIYSDFGGGGIYFTNSSGGYDYGATIKNCTITGNMAGSWERSAHGGGIYCDWGSNPRIINCTISGNCAQGWKLGGGIYCRDCNPTISNCIIWGNKASDGNEIALDGSSITDVNYCDVKGGKVEMYVDSGCTLNWGLGNIDVDPCFMDPGYWADANDPNIVVEPNDPNSIWFDGDYHLQSEGWRWDSERDYWKYDYVTSRCIDAGNPGTPLGEELLSIPVHDPCNIWGENLRINMGAYGGTAEASMPPYDWALLSDITNDGTVNFVGYAHLAEMYTEQDDELPADFDRNGNVALADLRLLAEDWLKVTSWYGP